MQKQIDFAVEQYRKLLNDQLARVERMENGEKAKDFTAMDKIVVGVCGGDGIGPIIVNEAKRVLDVLLKDEIESGKIEIREIEGLTIENRLAQNVPIPADTLEAIKACDVLLKGPTTTPKGGTMESANVALRRELDLYANVRPVCVPEENIDWIFYRENT
ncbi:MAG: isocitrate/isopropylmalate dehydrogenase family protein, partial [Oscillospiraceae bacterium]|nr:isocitrate/isopropylmalate dehydrogenase family protein [Oscillospiraceae bacterium]